MSFFNELKRRNVFRVGIAYAITAWLIAQIAGLAATSFFAPAWVGISWAYELQIRARYRTHAQGFALAREAAERALAIDDNMAIAWSTLGFLKKTYAWDWQGATAAMDKALQLEPNNADVIGGAATLASSLGQLDKSIELFERAVALDPLGLASP